VVFPLTRPDTEENRNHTDLWETAPGGGEARRLTASGSRNGDPAFSPDGSQLAFTSNRGGTAQVWVLPAEGGEARRVTDWPLGASRPVWFPDGKTLLATAPVFTDTNDREAVAGRVKEQKKLRKKTPDQPRIADDLMFRHWDAWTEGQLDHVFRVDAATGEMVDLTPGPYPAPPRSLGGDPDYAVSPDGQEVCFVSLRDDQQAVSTNLNLWVIPAAGGEPMRASSWAGVNAHPVYSPDGASIAFCGMRRAGYEADLPMLLVFDRKTRAVREVAPGFDHGAGVPRWSPDGAMLFFETQDAGCSRVCRVSALGGTPEPLTSGAVDGGPAVAPDGKTLFFSRQTLTHPPMLARVAADGGDVEIIHDPNPGALETFGFEDGEDFWFKGADGHRVHGLLVRPPAFDAAKKYPVVFLIHGGPQSMFGQDFHDRWNAQLFAAPGYVTVMINPRGSTGYGQAFTDAIRGEWGGKCYEDLIRGVDHVLGTYDFCDPKRTAAAGASFGGFMVNWMATQTDQFRCFVCHDGIFNTEMMNWLTDELWFTEWEFEGLPHKTEEAYRRWSPHRFVHQANTPMLVIQGEQDFRCVTAEGLGMFTALQRHGVPSRLLYFPDEGHWVLKPKNREVWWSTVLEWLGRYLKD